ncbi:MAG TPA: hypothetical protein VGM80_13625 [Gaiellaceae bacterium]
MRRVYPGCRSRVTAAALRYQVTANIVGGLQAVQVVQPGTGDRGTTRLCPDTSAPVGRFYAVLRAAVSDAFA